MGSQSSGGTGGTGQRPARPKREKKFLSYFFGFLAGGAAPFATFHGSGSVGDQSQYAPGGQWTYRN